jgi:NAD+ synthase
MAAYTPKERSNIITKWIKDYAKQNKIKTLVVGVSGGIDSAVVSTLCAKTKLPVIVVSMPIKQIKKLHSLSQMQCDWLTKNYKNVKKVTVDLTPVFKSFSKAVLAANKNFDSELAFANTKARLRMAALYQIAQSNQGIVVGTGNKVEDFGVGFFTKYGDGGVDISPIAGCMKTEVWDMGKYLGVPKEIIEAPPTDGLWTDGRTDEAQIGVSYQDLEFAMRLEDANMTPLTEQGKEALRVYRNHRNRNMHKMLPIPVCKF